MIRAFIGLSVPDMLAGPLLAAQTGLPGRLIERENLHLTLAFLGDVQEPRLEDVHLALEEIDAPPVTLAVDGVGVFGGAEPRTAHAAIRPDPALMHLRQKVARAVRACRVEMDGRRFTPHVTLARFSGLSFEDAQALSAWGGKRAGLSAGPVAAFGFQMFRSHLGRMGASYEVLADYPLGGAAAGFAKA